MFVLPVVRVRAKGAHRLGDLLLLGSVGAGIYRCGDLSVRVDAGGSGYALKIGDCGGLCVGACGAKLNG